jgi:CPA2 family monovalent cation:H+ antiporter-2
MHGGDFLLALTLVLCVGVVTSALFHRLHLPVVLGYIVAGLIIGPHVPVPLVADAEIVHALSELGVILLMFALGLEFSIRKLVAVGPSAAITAAVQCSVMLWLGFLTGRMFGWGTKESIIAGAIVAISSTTIIAKTFDELGVRGAVRELVVGVLVVEDLLAILLMAVLSTMFTGVPISAATLLGTAMRLGAFLAVLVGVGLLVIPRMLRAVSRFESAETLLLASVAICFALSLLARHAGYSVALGAFIAGSIVAESGLEKVIEPLVHPLRDVFAAIFFVSVGMLIYPAGIAGHFPAVAAFTLITIAGKIASVTAGALLAGNSVGVAVRSGMSMAQIGEFSFIIAGLAVAGGAPDTLYSIAVAVSAITTLSTPWLVQASTPAARRFERWLPRRARTFMALHASWLEEFRHAPRSAERGAVIRRLIGRIALDAMMLAVVIVGASLYGEEDVARWFGLPPVVARVVVWIGVTVVALPLLIGLVRLTRRLGAVVAGTALGQATEGKLDLAAAPRRAFSVTVQLIVALVVGTALLAVLQPFVPGPNAMIALAAVMLLLAFLLWRSVTDLEGHVRAGAEMIVEVLARQTAAPAPEVDPLHEVRGLLPGLGTPTPVTLSEASTATGKTLAELDLSGRTEATVLAIIREGQGVLVPSAGEILRARDVVVLAGSHDSLEAARQVLGATR